MLVWVFEQPVENRNDSMMLNMMLFGPKVFGVIDVVCLVCWFSPFSPYLLCAIESMCVCVHLEIEHSKI